MKHKIPLYRPTITKNDLISVLNCLVDEQIDGQKLTSDFEKKFNQLVKAKNNVVAINNPSNALYLIFKYLGIKPKDEIIVSPLADYFVLEVIRLFSAVPVWVDLELGRLTSNAEEIKAKITDKTKVVLITHHFGYPFDLEQLSDLKLSEKKIMVVEDNTSILGTKKIIKNEKDEVIQEKMIGTESDFGFYCFSSRRMLTSGIGSMIVTKSKNDARFIRSMRNSLEPQVPDEREETLLQPNNDRLDFSMNDINAAMGASEITLFEKFVKRRQEIRQYFIDVLMKTPHSFVAEDEGVVLNGYAFPVIFSSGIATAKEMFSREKIDVAGIEVGTIYERMDYDENLKVINELKLKLLQIPIYPTLKVEEIDHISKFLSSIG